MRPMGPHGPPSAPMGAHGGPLGAHEAPMGRHKIFSLRSKNFWNVQENFKPHYKILSRSRKIQTAPEKSRKSKKNDPQIKQILMKTDARKSDPEIKDLVSNYVAKRC